MKRILFIVIVVLAAMALIGAGYLYSRVADLDVVEVTGDLFMIKGFGGNVGVLRTSDGTVIVDTMTFEMQGGSIRDLAESLTGQPVRMIINTHYHFDHTHGNPAFPAGTRVVATANTLAHLRRTDAEFWKGDAAALLPNETFEHEHVVRLGGKTIRLLHPGRGHTDGDLVALFEDEGVLHAGDLFFNQSYPNIDLEAGGSVREWVGTIDTLLALPATRIIPGHGELTDRAGLIRFQDFMRELTAIGAAAVADGATLEETLGRATMTTDAGYGSPIDIPFVTGLDRTFVVTRAWEEATGAVAPPAGP